MTSQTLEESFPNLRQYEVLEKIADGSMGSVYKACQRETNQLVALKVIAPEVACNAVLLKRFEQEFRVARQLCHPNLVQALDFGQEGQTCYLVLEFIDGEDLWDRLQREGRLPEDEAVRILVQVAQGLHQAHIQGIIHRDVKPDNILLTANGQAKLADLGLAKDLETDADLTRVRSGLGTPNFIAPEQFHDAKHAGVRCDIYSLGATLYMAVTGQMPFNGKTIPAILKKKANNDIPAPRQLVPELSERVDWVIRRAINANPSQRYASCREFVQALTGENKGTGPEPAFESPAAVASSSFAGKPLESERRVAVRYACHVDTACHLTISIHPDDSETQDCWEGTVQNLSVSGLRLFLRRRFEPGTILNADLQSPDQQFTRRVQMRVTWVHRANSGQWFLGCSFPEPIAKDELRKLL